jgi:hypothetical protein
MFRAPVRPSSGEQAACHCLWFSVLATVVVDPESRVARCVHCAEDVACTEKRMLLALCIGCCLHCAEDVACTVQRMLLKQHPLHGEHISLSDSPDPQHPQSGQKIIGSDMQTALLMMGVRTHETC